MKKFLAVSLGRVDWNIWKPILSNLKNLNIDIAATGMHFDKNYGSSYKQIIKDGFIIKHKIKVKYSASSSEYLNNQIAEYLTKFSKIFKKEKYDFLILIGDRFESVAASISAISFGIPIIHFHGGEITEGSIDNQYRHAITKLSNFHLVTHEDYKKRVIQMGKEKKKTFTVGSPGVNNINKKNIISKKNFFLKYNLNNKKKLCLVSFNSETMNYKETEKQLKVLNDIFRYLKNFNIIITHTNYDLASNKINKFFQKSEKEYKNIQVHKYLGEDYFGAMMNAVLMIGNSSSGIIESPSFKIPFINLGSRQKGRVLAKNILNCEFNSKKIIKLINYSLSKKFLKTLNKLKNPYENKNFQLNLIKALKSITNLPKKNITKKIFTNI